MGWLLVIHAPMQLLVRYVSQTARPHMPVVRALGQILMQQHVYPVKLAITVQHHLQKNCHVVMDSGHWKNQQPAVTVPKATVVQTLPRGHNPVSHLEHTLM